MSSVTTDSSTQTRDTNAANEITSTTGIATPTYDAAGNMISDGTLNYKYDAWNRQVKVSTMVGETERTVAEYVFDGANRRVEKTVYDLSSGDPAATTDYFYNRQWQVLEERMLPAGESQSTVVTQYVWDQSYIDTPVVRFRDAETLYYTTDANHNVTSLVDTSGDVVERYVYDSYGNVTFRDGAGTEWTPLTVGGNNTATRSGVSSAYSNEILYCGYRLDPETSLILGSTAVTIANYQVRTRELITQFSTFDVRDSIGYRGGINLYEYVGDSPITRTDPAGFDWVWPWDPNAVWWGPFAPDPVTSTPYTPHWCPVARKPKRCTQWDVDEDTKGYNKCVKIVYDTYKFLFDSWEKARDIQLAKVTKAENACIKRCKENYSDNGGKRYLCELGCHALYDAEAGGIWSMYGVVVGQLTTMEAGAYSKCLSDNPCYGKKAGDQK